MNSPTHQFESCYFCTFSVASSLTIWPLTGSVTDVDCAVWPSRSTSVKVELKLRNAGAPVDRGRGSDGGIRLIRIVDRKNPRW